MDGVKPLKTMKRQTESKEKPTFDEQKYQQMYLEAIARPGIREVVQVYGSWSKESPKKISSPSASDDA